MKNVIKAMSAISFVAILQSCNSNPINTTNYPLENNQNNDVNRNLDELKRRQEAEKRNTTIDNNNDYGRPK